jgi:uncharacterized SAM-binding protein YcdF (DUF218 family)
VSGYDAVLVPGGGVRESGQLSPWVELRLDKALELADGVPILTLSAGTTHNVPPREPNGWPLFEAVAMARYLQKRGHPPELIWPEAASYDTIGNAYFARLTHTEPAGLRKLMVVTSMFHLPRTEQIFRWVFSLDPPVHPYQMSFFATPDSGMSPEVLSARRTKEITRIATLGPLVKAHQTLASLHRWLFTGHSAYAIAAAGLKEQARDKLLDSY